MDNLVRTRVVIQVANGAEVGRTAVELLHRGTEGRVFYTISKQKENKWKGKSDI